MKIPVSTKNERNFMEHSIGLMRRFKIIPPLVEMPESRRNSQEESKEETETLYFLTREPKKFTPPEPVLKEQLKSEQQKSEQPEKPEESPKEEVVEEKPPVEANVKRMSKEEALAKRKEMRKKMVEEKVVVEKIETIPESEGEKIKEEQAAQDSPYLSHKFLHGFPTFS